MNKKDKNQSGFSAVELLLLSFVIIAIGLSAYLVVRHYHSTTKIPVSTATAGWSTYKLTQEKATFKYPNNWKIDAVDPSENGGDDDVFVTGPNNFSAEIIDGVTSGLSSCPDSKIIGSISLRYDGQAGYLILRSAPSTPCLADHVQYTNKVDSVSLSKKPTDDITFPSKNPSNASHHSTFDYGYVSITGTYDINNGTYGNNGISISQAKKDTNYQNLIYLIESFTYTM